MEALKRMKEGEVSEKTAVVKGFLYLGVVFHLVYIWSIFDIYFKSPIVHGMTPVSPQSPPPAQRVVFFVGDGCRADKFFEENSSFAQDGRDQLHEAIHENVPQHENEGISRAPFLRKILRERGSWGVSHTRVPTESRPGHVAIFAGFYEDVSAVTRGWQANPVEFDSIFNQSSSAWLFGSPDIVPMFAKKLHHVVEMHYSHEDEDFAKDAAMLDVWVYEKVKAMFESAAHNQTLAMKLRQSQVVFFLHFLGIDTNGHAHRPNSMEYLSNIALVDSLVEKVVNIIEHFYGHDGQTAYIFTADHGMSNKGAHGDGDPTNTRTPLVAWGAGVRGPEPYHARIDEGDVESEVTISKRQVQEQWDSKSELEAKEWHLSGLRRKDVMQADIAPLIAALLGSHFPKNSVGVLPLSYLQPGRYRAEAIATNAMQIYAQASRKSLKKKATSLYFFPYAPLEATSKILEEIFDMKAAGKYDEVERKSHLVIKQSVDALNYFQTYDWTFLMSTICLGYVGWVLVLLVILWDISADLFGRKQRTFEPDWIDVTFPFVFLLTFAYIGLAVEHAPYTYFLYVFFPALFWSVVITKRASIYEALARFSVTTMIWFGVIVGGLELIVLGYSRREVFAVLFAAVSFWPWLDERRKCNPVHFPLKYSVGWTVACFSMCTFVLLPVEYGDNTLLVHIGMILFLTSVGCVQCVVPSLRNTRPYLIVVQLLLVVFSSILVQYTMMALVKKEKPYGAYSWLSWIVAFGSVPLALLASPQAFHRYTSIATSLVPAYILLSISYEVLFYCNLAVLLYLWIAIENALRSTPTVGSNIRLSFLFLLFIKIAFFGTGNIASMSSFEISSTYRFITVFSPFVMGALLVFKLLIPFTLVTSAFSIIGTISKQHPYSLFLVVLCMCDFLSLNFFFLVRDQGSWKEIGNSISMFGIVNAQIIFIPLMFLISRMFTRDILDPNKVKDQ